MKRTIVKNKNLTQDTLGSVKKLENLLE